MEEQFLSNNSTSPSQAEATVIGTDDSSYILLIILNWTRLMIDQSLNNFDLDGKIYFNFT